MRIFKLISSFALFALSATAQASPGPIDPSSDLDCAIIFNFYHRVAIARNAPADERELTFVMNAWFSTQWERQHPDEDAGHSEHFKAVATALGEDPNAYREMIRTCSKRATSDPSFGPFWILHRKEMSAAP